MNAATCFEHIVILGAINNLKPESGSGADLFYYLLAEPAKVDDHC